MRKLATHVFIVVTCFMIGFQVLLAAGAPLGRLAWGGQFQSALPTTLRLASIASALVLVLAGWVMLARADMVRPGAGRRWVRVGAWVCATFLSVNTLGNVMSRIESERVVMTPVSLLLAVCAFVIASSPRKPAVT